MPAISVNDSAELPLDYDQVFLRPACGAGLTVLNSPSSLTVTTTNIWLNTV